MEKKSNFAVKVIQLIFFAFVAKGFGFVREIVLANNIYNVYRECDHDGAV